MLNISEKSISEDFKKDSYIAFGAVFQPTSPKKVARYILIFFVILIGVLCLPWTQNIQASGVLTSLKPEQRPQTIQSTIAGRIEKWYVREGDLVQKGDTIVQLSEIKVDYFDPDLIDRTESQIEAKEGALEAYLDKVQALENQVRALEAGMRMKIEQTRNKVIQVGYKVISDSIDYQASAVNLDIAQKQLDREQELYKQGLKSLTDLEAKKLKVQETNAKMISQENKLQNTRNELLNAKLELETVRNEYLDKIAKSESEKFSAVTSLYDTEAGIAKMRNTLSNYSIRSGFYYITAPQTGYLTKAIKAGLGETVKEGEEIISIMPFEFELAVELYVKPMDFALMEKGQHVRFIFDGWPNIVFSGWPGASVGTFGGTVVAIDNFANNDGKYRVLVAPDKGDKRWPEALRPGSGAKGMALIKDVPLWYELWRQLNGFPPDYYKMNIPSTNKDEKKK